MHCFVWCKLYWCGLFVVQTIKLFIGSLIKKLLQHYTPQLIDMFQTPIMYLSKGYQFSLHRCVWSESSRLENLLICCTIFSLFLFSDRFMTVMVLDFIHHFIRCFLHFTLIAKNGTIIANIIIKFIVLCVLIDAVVGNFENQWNIDVCVFFLWIMYKSPKPVWKNKNHNFKHIHIFTVCRVLFQCIKAMQCVETLRRYGWL